MDGQEIWRWVWLGAAVLFAVGEMTTPGSFFLLPFALGAALAAVLAFLEVNVAVQWGVFVATSVGAFLAMRPLAKRLDRQGHADGVGSRRLIGARGVVIEAIEAGGSGMVKVGPEEWRAIGESQSDIDPGTRVQVVEVQGTRVVVRQLEGDTA